MSTLAGGIGKKKISWRRPPAGMSGTGEVLLDGKSITVSWRRDAEGLWVEFPHGTYGFDFYGEMDDTLGAMTYRVNGRGNDRLVSGVRVRGAGEAATAAASGGKKKATRVRAQMPGKIVRVLVKVGEEVKKDQPLLVMEAMKMENEIRATGPGKVETLKVSEGQAVESGADLILIG